MCIAESCVTYEYIIYLHSVLLIPIHFVVMVDTQMQTCSPHPDIVKHINIYINIL